MFTLRSIAWAAGPIAFILILFLAPFEVALENKVLAVAAWMLIWWVLEAVELYITAMLPMVLFPMLGILSVGDTFIPYANPIIFLFLGGFILALGMETHRLHERIAYGLLRLTGSKPQGIILGFMIATASVAMWISNTATAVMLLPIGMSVIQLVGDQESSKPILGRFALLMMLGIAYAANIGGMITLIGTPPNLVFAGYYYEQFGVDYSFLDWLKVGIPIGGLLLLVGYLLLTKVVYPIRAGKVEGVDALLEARWAALGKVKRAEAMVMIIFGLTVFLWITAAYWNELLGTRMFNNTSIAMLGGILMFTVPTDLKVGKFILQWSDAAQLPWGILILFGGGLSLAAGLDAAGFIDHMVGAITGLGLGSVFMLLLALTAFALFATEVMSNVALVTVLLPVVFGIAEAMEVDALLLTIPVTLAASCAFMMPISTPPNAVVYSSGLVSVKQMIRAGVWMNVLSIMIIVMVIYWLYG
jgi:sodium-dependent dicarboxylate transporter 2/3/5